jgi:signal transduction histidine kinase
MDHPDPGDKNRYRKLWWYSVLLMTLIAWIPLAILTAISIQQYQQALQVEMRFPVSQILAKTGSSLEFAIDEHVKALTLVINAESREEIACQPGLEATFANLRNAFCEFVDLGFIDSQGNQLYYVGPYNLQGRNFKDQPWFHEVRLRDVYVSDVFMGYRNFPHFIIAVKHVQPQGDYYILQATIDMQVLNNLILSPDLGASSDVFIVNDDAVLQTNSRSHGHILEKAAVPLPIQPNRTETLKEFHADGQTHFLSYLPIANSHFILVMVYHQQDLMKHWISMRRNPIWFLLGTSAVILLVVLGTSTYMVKRIHEADIRRDRILHNLEYTNKMAAIGRLAAGVAHEINNPISIINEKAGLLKDMADAKPEFTQREKVVALANSILNSVERCSAITHRLLGFSRRLEARIEMVDLELLLKEVLEFVSRELEHRNISIKFDVQENFAAIESDRGLLQQVFLNIINNALAALKNGGWIQFILRDHDEQTVEVMICDNGAGIAPHDLKHIFEPFFSTKGEFGTGLGLSITRDIVEKLDGHISVESQLGEGACFTILLPRSNV